MPWPDFMCPLEGRTKEFSDLQDDLGFCGCGLPEEATRFLRDVLEMVHRHKNEWQEKYGSSLRLREELDEMHQRQRNEHKVLFKCDHEGMYWTYLYWLDDKGLTEHGGNVSGCWLSPKGEKVLALLQSCSDFLEEDD